MKKEKILATVMSCAIIAVSAGCGANKTASTTAAETTTTTAAETTTTSAETTTTTESETTDEENPMEMTAPLYPIRKEYRKSLRSSVKERLQYE